MAASRKICEALTAAFATYLFQRLNERKRRREQTVFRVYMLLLELHGWYFWVVSKELHGDPPSPELAAKVSKVAMEIADALRQCDDIQHLDTILAVLMSEGAYQTATERSKALDSVIDKVGNEVNPRYAGIVKRISDENIKGFVDRPANYCSNAPAVMR